MRLILYYLFGIKWCRLKLCPGGYIENGDLICPHCKRIIIIRLKGKNKHNDIAVNTLSNQMYWILVKFLKESIVDLSSGYARGMNRGKYIEDWQKNNLSRENLNKWLPPQD
jgi:hypothetical protein